MRPYNLWQDSHGYWYFEVLQIDSSWISHGPFETKDLAEQAVINFMQHE